LGTDLALTLQGSLLLTCRVHGLRAPIVVILYGAEFGLIKLLYRSNTSNSRPRIEGQEGGRGIALSLRRQKGALEFV